MQNPSKNSSSTLEGILILDARANAWGLMRTESKPAAAPYPQLVASRIDPYQPLVSSHPCELVSHHLSPAMHGIKNNH